MPEATERLLVAELSARGIVPAEIRERTFPGEHWFVVLVPSDQVALGQSVAGELESAISRTAKDSETAFVVTFRPVADEQLPDAQPSSRGRLFDPKVGQLIQLLEARSRTSDALPSLRYVEDPRASLSAVCASRHHLIFGRRGVGKTALLLEAKRWAETHGHAVAWANAHAVRELDDVAASASIAEVILGAVAQHGGTSSSEVFERVRFLAGEIGKLRRTSHPKRSALTHLIPSINTALRSALRAGTVRLYAFIDDFYLLPQQIQPQVLDYLAAMLRDADGWLKVASIERLTRAYEPSTRTGLEVPHDATTIDLDITLQDPRGANDFLESVLSGYTTAAGIRSPGWLAKPGALSRLVLASGGVPRDYLNLFASSIVVARSARSLPREIGREDVAKAAGQSARDKKNDLQQDLSSTMSGTMLAALERFSAAVKAAGYTFFRVDASKRLSEGYVVLAQLADLRFIHLVQTGLSDQHQAGVKYEAYVLDLSEYTDIRPKRGLQVLDLDNGQWTIRTTGRSQTTRPLKGTQFRDVLRKAPLLDVDALA